MLVRTRRGASYKDPASEVGDEGSEKWSQGKVQKFMTLSQYMGESKLIGLAGKMEKFGHFLRQETHQDTFTSKSVLVKLVNN